MSTIDRKTTNLSTADKIRRSVDIVRTMTSEDRLQLLVRAGLMSQAEADEKLAVRRGGQPLPDEGEASPDR